MDNLYFDSGKSTIKKGSYAELNELYTYLKLKEDARIEIGGHTDDVGEEASNKVLSKDRALAVKKFLVSKGIAQSRIATVGYGEGKPRATNLSEQGRQMNRRTEVKVL